MKPTAQRRAQPAAGLSSTDADASTTVGSGALSSSAVTTAVKAAVRVRPLVDTERQAAEGEHHAGGGAAAPPLSPSSAAEVIRVATAAGKLTRPMESAYTLEVLQPSHSTQTKEAGAKSTLKGRGAAASSVSPLGFSSTRAKAYAFDYCAGPTTTQAELFKQLDMAAMCEAALSGQVVTVFCFGQTGSGKTFTLSGRTLAEAEVSGPDGPLVSEDGLQYQAAAYVARRLKEMRHAFKKRHAASRSSSNAPQDGGARGGGATGAPQVVAKCSYVELYQETLYDLLQPESTEAVRCRWSAAAQSFYVEGSLLVGCRSKEDFLMVLREGQRNRQRGSHALNRDSSRSHVVFTMFFEVHAAADINDRAGMGGKEEEGGVDAGGAGGASPEGAKSQGRRYGRLVFVDLAGSERLKKSQSSSGAETGSINRSLFTLGRVLELLSIKSAPSTEAKPTAKPPFIPYRSSVLTQLLMQSLDGHGLTLMVACVSPSALHLDESLRTLHYAQRARHIRTTPVVHVDADTQRRMALEEKVRELQRENALLRRALQLPRAGPLSEEVVQAQVAALRLMWGSRAPAIRGEAASFAAAAAAVISPPGRVAPFTTPFLGEQGAVPHPVTPTATRTGRPSRKENKAAFGIHPSQPAPPPSTTSADAVSLQQSPSPSPVTASGDSSAVVNIMALLDALPDTLPTV
ncbi:kinesin-like protein [Leptomonas seymouri]|uniref:Kinesin-like protein n=1 Tax=Leptomonas seymouri TaxID=5684 RepID=A0A0N1HY56_LEPSE|nr:kinesin-like protein [Leptomonas seymouri]|eukprot:KPI87638.1 kinesin-like protein [Leptomonas seymouri]